MPVDWSGRVLRWFARHGRHDLPWQHPRSPYRVWVSEVMLQQTSVATVRPYFERFMSRLPDLAALAAAPEDELMALWSGLGYYARARNLHRAAKRIVHDLDGQMPGDMAALQALPGIGRSTAAAILAQAFDQPAAILDGNVRRLLARHAGVEGWSGQAAVQKALWQIAEQRLPDVQAANYAQALMDLGATICTRRRPMCERCPVNRDCQAYGSDRVDQIPAPRPRRARPRRAHWYLILRNAEAQILLEKRPAHGIWGGLWSLPEAKQTIEEFAPWAEQIRPLGDGLQHEFSHFSLTLQPVTGRVREHFIADDGALSWHTVNAAVQLGLPQPIRRLIEIHCV